MRIILALAALFVLAGCETMEFVAVDYHSGHNYGPYIRHTDHISYTLGYYSGSYYNGYRVYGNHGHRYYHAPRNYRHHRHYSRPVVVNNYYTPPRHTLPRHTTPPRSTPPRSTPRNRDDRDRNHRNDRREDSQDRNDRRRDPKRKRK